MRFLRWYGRQLKKALVVQNTRTTSLKVVGVQAKPSLTRMVVLGVVGSLLKRWWK